MDYQDGPAVISGILKTGTKEKTVHRRCEDRMKQREMWGKGHPPKNGGVTLELRKGKNIEKDLAWPMPSLHPKLIVDLGGST